MTIVFLKNVKTRWMLMLESLKKIMTKYRPLLAMMQINCNSTLGGQDET
jgi:hypothetical protein